MLSLFIKGCTSGKCFLSISFFRFYFLFFSFQVSITYLVVIWQEKFYRFFHVSKNIFIRFALMIFIFRIFTRITYYPFSVQQKSYTQVYKGLFSKKRILVILVDNQEFDIFWARQTNTSASI